MNKQNLIATFSQRLAAKTPLTVAQFAQAFTDSNAATKQQIVTAANARDAKLVAELLIRIVDTKRLELATATVTAAFADDTVSTADLIAFL